MPKKRKKANTPADDLSFFRKNLEAFPVEHFLIFTLVFGLTLFYLFTLPTKTEEAPPPVQASALESVEVPKPFVNPFDNLQVEAKAAYVFDLKKNRVLFAKNEDLRLPLASITKVMTALLGNEKASEDSRVEITLPSVLVLGESGFFPGETWKMKDLIDFTLLTSSNDGADAIAKHIEILEGRDFISLMNEKALSIGMENTEFKNPTGLDLDYITSGAYGTSKDISTLFAYILRGPSKDLLEATRYQSLSLYSIEGKPYTALNTNLALGVIPNLIGSKTGLTDLAGGNLGFAFNAGIDNPIITIILGSTESGRFRDAKKLADTALVYLREE